MQLRPAGQVRPHAPQFIRSVRPSMHRPPQSMKPGGQAQTPALHAWSIRHALPQAPQCDRDDDRGTQLPAQSVLVPVHPEVQPIGLQYGRVGGHALKQAPQWLALLRRPTHMPPQLVSPLGHEHAPGDAAAAGGTGDSTRTTIHRVRLAVDAPTAAVDARRGTGAPSRRAGLIGAADGSAGAAVARVALDVRAAPAAKNVGRDHAARGAPAVDGAHRLARRTDVAASAAVAREREVRLAAVAGVAVAVSATSRAHRRRVRNDDVRRRSHVHPEARVRLDAAVHRRVVGQARVDHRSIRRNAGVHDDAIGAVWGRVGRSGRSGARSDGQQRDDRGEAGKRN